MTRSIRWGFLGTGAVAHDAASDLALVADARPQAVASRTPENAQRFAARYGFARSWGNLADLLRDPEVEVVYIATPQHRHHEDCLSCLEAGKAVLCEKPFTLNVAQATRIVDAARAQRVFCMEAMWMRFIPAIVEVKRRIAAGEVGAVRMLLANFAYPTHFDPASRLFSLEQGGGALLDRGVYTLSLAHHLLGKPQSIVSKAVIGSTGVDEQSSYLLTFASGALADLSASLCARGSNEALIMGERGQIRLHDPFYRAHRLTARHDEPPRAPAPDAAPAGFKARLKRHPSVHRLRRLLEPWIALAGRGQWTRTFPGNGYQFEIAEVNRCLQQGLLESPVMPLDETLAIMQTMDAIRAQWGISTVTQDARPNSRALAYLVSQYPMLSMIFIIREVMQLKRLGFRIDVASINAPDRGAQGLTADEAEESKATYYIKSHGVRGALLAHLKTLLGTPAGYGRGWWLVLKLSGLDLRKFFYNLMHFTEALMVGVWMQQKDQTHLHAHLGSQAATVALYVKRVHGYGLSITVHGPDEFYNAPGQYLTEKVIAADFICCISSFNRSQLMKLSPYEHWHKLVVARLGVDPQVFAPRPFNPAPQAFEIICVGRLTSAKGQHILVEAIDRLIRAGRKVRLRIVGDGTDRASLQQQVQALGLVDHVIFEGAVNQDRIRELYARADAFAIASFAEGIPVVLMEAMAMEIPCVTTRITGIPELIRDGIDGLLVAPSDSAELADALARLIDDPALRQRLGKSGRQRVIEHFDLARNVDHLADIFRERIVPTAPQLKR